MPCSYPQPAFETWGLTSISTNTSPRRPKGWPRWMTNQIDWADSVLVICTETYYRRAMGLEEHGRGLGATYESTLINQQIFEAGGRNEKFLPCAADLRRC